MKFFALILIAICHSSCNQSQINDQSVNNNINSEITASNSYTIIPYDTLNNKYTKENNKPTSLTSNNLNEIELLLTQCVESYNLKNKDQIILKDYERIYIPYSNSSGNKEVSISCSCTGKFEMVIDGGKCYFKLRINLDTKKCTPIIINSQG